ncbi:cation:proton antiporter [Bacillus salipaludis]|uniref:cation:proton antiporter n=1 Tax=Bacillus salipaludis TaxID=2547811 RepID=UPI002E1BB03A|nr:cation:proton antiporter [Bacillus salipaludis]
MFTIEQIQVSHFLFAMGCLLALAHILGYLCERIYIPRVIGEVGAGIILGPSLLGYFYPQAYQWLFHGFPLEDQLFGLIYQIGLILLMFVSGLKFHTEFEKDDLKITSAITIGSSVLPFIIGWLVTSFIDLNKFVGTANDLLALKLIVCISIAVTSIPVISKIFIDLGIMKTRFAKLVVIIAGLHDILLWVVLGVATNLVAHHSNQLSYSDVLLSIGTTCLFLVGILFVLRVLFKHLTMNDRNIFFRSSNLGYVLVILFIACVLAYFFHVETIFGALLVGIAAKLYLPGTVSEKIEEGVSNLSFSWFVPVYFATVGLQLDLAKSFDIYFFIEYLLIATFIQITIVYFTCRLIKLNSLTSLNFGFAMNARGGPGIVLSTVAFMSGIINQEFFAILVMLALVTSWMTGTWLRFVIKNKWDLM